MRRGLVPAATAVLTLLAVSLAPAPAQAAPATSGNSANAKQCQKDGWKRLYTSTGRPFVSEQDCTSYAAKGGVLRAARTLTVSRAGTGTGTVSSSPGGITCGTDCSESYPDGTSVTLTATPGAGSTFTGWSGACSGTSTCTLSMTADRAASASFALISNIFLGYADTNRNLTTEAVPSPWRGDPGVVFVGCVVRETACGDAYDAGAIRIDNPTGSPSLTLTAASVDIGPCHFAPWDVLLPATAAPGEVLVLTQTGLFGPPQPAPCDGRESEVDRPLENFDTSEGPFDTTTPPFSNCDPTLTPAPVIHLSFSDGSTLTVTDAAKVLSTGGVDRFACFGQDEARPWTAVPVANVTRTP